MHESTLADYTFLPWLRQGIAGEISNPDDVNHPPVGERAAVTVQFKVNEQPVSKAVELIGPGDITGINPRAIVKTEPRNWITDFEPNYLPYIEFYEEDFPWRYTPAAPVGALDQSRLRPWLALIVLSEEEFKDDKAAGPLPAIKITADAETVFPKPEQIWAWAHVHVNKNILEGAPNITHATTSGEADAGVDRLEAILAENPDNASSRLICPRKLKKNTAYHAFLIPSFEPGRLTGLGQTTTLNALASSWGNGQTDYPVYYRWYFRTGERGDFEFLVDLLEPRPVDKRVGIRDMDMQTPLYEVDGMTGDFSVVGLEGALKSPKTEPFPVDWPPAGANFDPPLEEGSEENFLIQLEEKVNLQFTVQQQLPPGNPSHPDPIVSPPLYGKWHAKAEKLRVQEPGWVNELNKDPRNRTAAGNGTNVIQQNQERYMQQAWSQLGDVLQANQKIRQLQLALTASFQIYQKHFVPMAETQLLLFTLPVHAKILGSPTTIAQQVKESRLPMAVLDPAFRKITRPRGAVMKKAAPLSAVKPVEMIALLNDNKLSAAPVLEDAKSALNLNGSVEAIAVRGLPDWLQKLLAQKVMRWILAGLMLLVLLLTPLIGLMGVAVSFAAVGAILVASERLANRITAADTFKEENWKPEAVNRIAARPNFSLSAYGTPMPAVSGEPGKDSVEAGNFRAALKDMYAFTQSDPPPLLPKAAFALDNAAQKIRTALNPVNAITGRTKYVVKIPASVSDAYLKPRKTIVPIMAHPVFADPMYRPLRDVSAELLVPNLALIPNNTVSLMEVNERFIESYLVGLNHEMGRELLWREYPTDQRGSYFRQFWDVGDRINRDKTKTDKEIEEAFLDVKPLHTWVPASALGEHGNLPAIPGAQPGEERLVVVVRGDVLKKYPTAVIFAQKAMWSTDGKGNDIRVLDDTDPAHNLQDPVFKAEIEPDIKFLGFNLTASIVKGSPVLAAGDPGWFFVIQERPGEPRFGLDNKSHDTPLLAAQWNDLAWEHLENFDTLNFIDLDKSVATTLTSTPPSPMQAPDNEIIWGRNAADMAYILYQVPVMVAFHAADMLE